jgi:hypothetical protein
VPHGTRLSRFPSSTPRQTVSSPASSHPRDAGAEASSSAGTPGQPSFAVGEQVRLAQRPPYLKSADPMPMLRPPDLIDEGETGVVVELRALEQRAVRFRRGTFLLTVGQLRPIALPPEL